MFLPPEFKVLSIFIMIFVILWIGTALFKAIAPYTFWKITQSWKPVREPPNEYFVMQRIKGILFAAVGISFWVFVWTRK